MIGKSTLIILGSAMLLRASPSTPDSYTEGIRSFNSAYQSWNSMGFWNAAHQFRKATQSHPKSALYQHWLGTARFHRMLVLKNTTHPSACDLANANAEIDAAIESLEIAAEIDPKNAESHAILGTLYGMKIDGSILRAIRCGPSVQSHQKQALEYGANNPRVQYLLGASLYHTAKNADDYHKALKSLLLAEELFLKEERQAQAWDNSQWGKDGCLHFIAKTYAALKDKTHATEYFQKALVIRPNHPLLEAEFSKLQNSH